MATNIGTGPEDIPLNQFLGELAFEDVHATDHFQVLASDPATGVVGECYYNSTDNQLKVYDGTSWTALSGGGGGGGGGGGIACKTTEAMRTLGTPIGNMTQDGGLAAAFNGAINGDYQNGARKDPSAGATIGRDFGEVVGVSGITLYRPDGNGTSGSNCFPGEGDGTYQFQYSSNGTDWTTIEQVEGTPNKSITVSFTKTDAQYWRVLFSGDTAGGTVQEMQFHCSEAPAHQIAYSGLFDDDLNTKLSRTYGAGISSNKFSFSWWQKMLTQKENNVITSNGSGGCVRFMEQAGPSGDPLGKTLEMSVKVAGATLTTSRLFVDFTGWQHFLVTYDGTVGSAADRVRIYCNGEPVSYAGGGSIGSTTSTLGGSNEHVIGGQQHNNSHGYDGYLAEMHWCDGIIKYPTDFGEINPTTKQWDPISYTGAHGSEGWHLTFGNNGNYGEDSSGNGNNWSQSGFSLTPGARHQSVDSPTNYGTATTAGKEVRGNYCTFNSLYNKPLNTTDNPPDIRYGNLTVTHATTDSAAVGTMSVASGKWYWEGKWITLSPSNDTSGFGFYTLEHLETNSGYNSYGDAFRGHRYRGTGDHFAYTGAANDVTITKATAGDWYGLALDIDNNTFTIYRNGTQVVTTTAANTSGKGWIPATFADGTCELEFNFGQRPWNYAPPSADYKPMCSAMITDPYYVDPTQCFGQINWTGTGTGGTRTITDTHAVEFAPDLVWSKAYNGTAYHNQFYDSIRGFTSKANGVGALVTDLTSAEGTPSGGFIGNTGIGQIIYEQEGSGTGYEWYDQNSSHDYVARCWNAGGANQTLTNGEITATVRANQNCGFSIVGWTGPNNTNDHDVPHGLSKAPEFIIVKNRDTTFNWDIYHHRLPAAESFVFSNAAGRQVDAFQNTDPTATTFPVKHNFTTNENEAYIAYCWHSVEGLSSFGCYIGNGDNNGPVYNCGFRPSLIIIKGDTASAQWFVHDDARDPEKGDGNPSTKEMAWETDQLQYDTVAVGAGQRLVILSNGFKIRTSNGACNSGSVKYHVMAWARSPFKYSRGR